MSNMQIVDHGDTAVVTCKGTYVTEGRTMMLKFMRVWVKKQGRWRIVAATVSR
jgi:ketosteroid isomerase-like protein